jgi:hypothetical protein
MFGLGTTELILIGIVLFITFVAPIVIAIIILLVKRKLK